MVISVILLSVASLQMKSVFLPFYLYFSYASSIFYYKTKEIKRNTLSCLGDVFFSRARYLGEPGMPRSPKCILYRKQLSSLSPVCQDELRMCVPNGCGAKTDTV